MNPALAAIFVTAIAIGILFALGASLGFVLWDRAVGHFARTEVDSLEEARDVTGRSKDATNVVVLHDEYGTTAEASRAVRKAVEDAMRRHPSGGAS